MIKLIADSTCDIPAQELEKYNIATLSVPITIDGTTYREGVDFTPEEYYPILAAAKEIPIHAQVTMVEFAEQFATSIAEGYNEIIVTTITSCGSGIYDAARLAHKLMQEEQPALMQNVRIEVIDSHSYSYVYGLAVVEGGRAVEAGKSMDEVVATIRDTLDSYYATVGLTNLTYAKKSGRITTVAAFVGEVLGFRPILVLEDGELKTKTKVRGNSKLIEEMVSIAVANTVQDGRPYYIIVADSMENAKEFKKQLAKKMKNPFGGFYRIGPSVVTNAGPTIFGVATPCAARSKQ